VIRTDQDLGRGDGVYSEALQDNPLGMAYDSAGKLIFKPTPDGQRVNPLSDIANWTDERLRTRVFGTLFADYYLTDALDWRVNFGADLSFFRRGVFRGAETQAMQGSGADGGLWQTRTLAYTLDNILTYRRTLGNDHRLDATLLYSIQRERTEEDTSHVKGLAYESGQFYDLASALKIDGLYSALTEWALQSVMTRFNYALKDRYLLTVTGRLDGSSRLAPGHKYALFPSVALAWRLSEESFIRRTNLFSDLKLRASYGRTGNTAVDPYQTQGTLSRVIYAFGDQPAIGFRPGTLPNPDLRWEKTGQLDVGLEFTTRNGRLSGSVDYYRAYTSDLLMERQIPTTTGYQRITQNIGATRNVGAEVALSAVPVENWRGLRWSTQLTWATNRNRIVRLASGVQRDLGNSWFVGYPIQVYYDYRFAGIWQRADSAEAARYGGKVGQIRVADTNGDGKIDAEDRVILGTNFPEWTSSVINRFDWKGIDLSVMAIARVGFMVNNQFRTDNSTLAGRYNNLYVDYWTPTNPSNTEPRPIADQERPDFGSARAYEDGSFIRVRSITLGYTLPGAHLGVLRARSLRVYATALDPFLFTRFRGLDPESRTSAGTPSYWTVLTGVTMGL
jgi:TonB-linked SusC/RagA family outer membrane protein